MPSHWKICSTMTLPEIRYGIVRPRIVIIGIRALRKAWRHSTADGAAPLARGAPEAERNADGGGEQKGDQVQEEGVRHLLGDVRCDRPAVEDGAAEVQGDDAAHPPAVLRDDRLVEVVLVADLGDDRRRHLL